MTTRKLFAHEGSLTITLKLDKEQDQLIYNGTHTGSLPLYDSLSLSAQGKQGQRDIDKDRATPLSTSGENGDRGGDITVFVEEGDEALLDVIEHIDVSGGAGGAPGKQQWIPVYYYRDVPPTFGYCRIDKKPIITSYIADPDDLKSGTQGALGKTTIKVGTNKIYSEAYHLSMSSLINHENSTFEYGQFFSVRHTMINRGSMPFIGATIPVQIKENPLLTLESTTQFSTPISMDNKVNSDEYSHIKLKHPSTEDAKTSKITLEFYGYNSALQRPYRNTTTSSTLTVGYPLCLEAQFPPFVIPGEKNPSLILSVQDVPGYPSIKNRPYKVVCHDDEKSFEAHSAREMNFGAQVNTSDWLQEKEMQVQLFLEPIDEPGAMRLIQTKTLSIRAIPVAQLDFSQKLQKMLVAEKNVYHKDLLQTILDDLLAEQKDVTLSKTPISWWAFLTRTYQRDFGTELQKLTQLMQTLNELKASNHPELFDAFSPSVIQLIAAVQYQAVQHSTFWTKLLHIFFPQINELLKNSILQVCNNIVAIQAQAGHKSMRDIQSEFGDATARYRLFGSATRVDPGEVRAENNHQPAFV
ncbi:MAG: hypothetical protein CK424_00215 [Legionella sp.]|nr:MAG: hypothetical protein CK424_00215 [Legionella sp.]